MKRYWLDYLIWAIAAGSITAIAQRIPALYEGQRVNIAWPFAVATGTAVVVYGRDLQRAQTPAKYCGEPQRFMDEIEQAMRANSAHCATLSRAGKRLEAVAVQMAVESKANLRETAELLDERRQTLRSPEPIVAQDSAPEPAAVPRGPVSAPPDRPEVLTPAQQATGRARSANPAFT